MISTSAKIYNAVLRVIQPRRIMLRIFTHPPRSKKKAIPGIIKRSFELSHVEIQGRPVVTLQKKQSHPVKHIIFLHGGAYVLEMSRLHWKAIYHMMKTADCKLSYIDYPLAPEHGYKETFSMLEESFRRLTSEYPGDEFILMGDSAGGGLALAFLQQLRDRSERKIPQKTILFSPWLDLVMDNDEIRQMEKTEMYLNIRALRAAALSYAKDEPLSHPCLSPINGKMNDLGEILVFAGSHELFLPDCRKLKTKIDRSNSKVILKEYTRMQHDWLIAGIPESKRSIQEISTFIAEN